MAQRVRMEDVAKRLGVSKYAVSLAMRGLPGIGDETRSRILKTAEDIGYVYKRGLSGEDENDIKNICIIISQNVRNSEGFFEYIQYGIEKEARANKINCIVFCCDEGPYGYDIPLSLKQEMICGVIIIGGIERSYIGELKKYNVPIVIVDHYFEDALADCILTDNINGAFSAVSYLIELGHTEIGFCGDIYEAPSFFDRWLGYVKALKCFNIEHREALHIKSPEAWNPKAAMPTAIICCNDKNAIELVKLCGLKGIRIPQDISVIGFDDIPSAARITPELTTVRVMKEEMGVKALRRVLCRMGDPEDAGQNIIIPTRIIKRKSAAGLNIKTERSLKA